MLGSAEPISVELRAVLSGSQPVCVENTVGALSVTAAGATNRLEVNDARCCDKTCNLRFRDLLVT